MSLPPVPPNPHPPAPPPAPPSPPPPPPAPAPGFRQPVPGNNPLNEFKDEWSKSMDDMKGNLANMTKFLTEMRSLLEELKTLLEPNVPTTIDDVIKSTEKTIVSNHDLTVDLIDLNKKIENLKITGYANDHPALKKLLEIKDKINQLRTHNISSTAPVLKSNNNSPNKPIKILKELLLLPTNFDISKFSLDQKAYILNLINLNKNKKICKDLEVFLNTGLTEKSVKNLFEKILKSAAGAASCENYEKILDANDEILKKEKIVLQIINLTNPTSTAVLYNNELVAYLIKFSKDTRCPIGLKSDINKFSASRLLVGLSELNKFLPSVKSSLENDIKLAKLNISQLTKDFLVN